MINEIADWRGNASSFNRRKTVPNCRSKRGGSIISWIAGKRDGRGGRAWPSIIYLSLNPVDASWTNVSTETYLPSFPLIEDEDAQS